MLGLIRNKLKIYEPYSTNFSDIDKLEAQA